MFRLGTALDEGARERPATDLQEHPVEFPASARSSASIDFVRERLAALDGQAVVRSLAAERDGPGVDGLPKAQVTGIACLSRLAARRWSAARRARLGGRPRRRLPTAG